MSSCLDSDKAEDLRLLTDSLLNLITPLSKWPKVGVLARIARELQGAIAVGSDHDRAVIESAISAAEQSAGNATPCLEWNSLAGAAQRVTSSPLVSGKPRATAAATCAAHAAAATRPGMTRSALQGIVSSAVDSSVAAIKVTHRRFFVEIVQGIANLSAGLSDIDPAPPRVLSFVAEQAVHEAGHTFVAFLSARIPIEFVRIIYEPCANPVHDPFDHLLEATEADLTRFRHFAAGGSAAELVVYGQINQSASGADHNDTGSDRHHHFRFCRSPITGVDARQAYDRDAAEGAEIIGRYRSALDGFVQILAERRELNMHEVEEHLIALGLPDPY